jgi:hypothetical protein
MKQSFKKKELSEALLKKALGYSLEEIIEEYVVDKEKEELVLNKKKITKKKCSTRYERCKNLTRTYQATK